MGLTQIEYGSLASSDIMNSNFEYLDNRISNVAENLIATSATINSNIATVNSSVSHFTQEINNNINNLNNTTNQVFSDNALYITTYRNGKSWYREYFTNSSKTQRVWLEQGFLASGINNARTSYNIPLLKSFNDTNYTIICTPLTCGYTSDHDYGTFSARPASNNSIVVRKSFSVSGPSSEPEFDSQCYIYACGY